MKALLLALALVQAPDNVILNEDKTDWVVVANGPLRDPVFVRDGRTVWVVNWESGTKRKCE